MIYTQYGIELVRLEKHQIEMLREWRNTSEIKRNMEFQENISPEMQSKWFTKINTINNFYFLIKKEKEWIGMIHLSDIDRGEQIAKSGIFISHPSYLKTSIPVFASLMLLDFAFDNLKLHKIQIKVKKENQPTLKYNQHLGFKYIMDSANPQFILMELSKRFYQQKVKQLKEKLKLIHPDKKQFSFNDNIVMDQEIKRLFF